MTKKALNQNAKFVQELEDIIINYGCENMCIQEKENNIRKLNINQIIIIMD